MIKVQPGTVFSARKKKYLKTLGREVGELESPYGYLYGGLPKFRALYGRDSLISGWQLMDWREEIAASAVRALARLQGKAFNPEIGEFPGKIPHEYFDSRSEYEKRKEEVQWLPDGPNYFSVDSTPLFVIVAGLLRERSPDSVTHDVVNSVANSLKFLVDNADGTGLLTYEKPPIGTGIQSQSWRDGIGDILDRLKSPVATVGVQGYLFRALEDGIKLLDSERSKRSELLTRMRERISSIPGDLEKYLWSEEDSYYALAVDGDGVAERAITSDPGHLVFSGVLPRERERDVIDRLFESDLLTDYGIRTLSARDERFDAKAYQRGSVWPQDNWIISLGLRSRGYHNLYRDLRERLLLAYERMGMMPEYFGVDGKGELLPVERMRIRPCYPQAWSTGAIVSFLTEGEGGEIRGTEVLKDGSKA